MAIAGGAIFIRSDSHLYRIQAAPQESGKVEKVEK
jgi:hypothetical protein